MTEVIVPRERDISSTVSPGMRLKRAREAARLDPQAVARQLYLTENIILALEKDEYEKLPGLTFARGYLRAYAKLLNISADEIIQIFEGLGLTEEHPLHFQLPLVKAQSNSMDRYIRWVTYGLAGILILLFLMWWQSSRKPTSTTASTQAPAATAVTDSTTLETQSTSSSSSSSNLVLPSNNLPSASDNIKNEMASSENSGASSAANTDSSSIPTSTENADSVFNKNKIEQHPLTSSSAATSSDSTATISPSAPATASSEEKENTKEIKKSSPISLGNKSNKHDGENSAEASSMEPANMVENKIKDDPLVPPDDSLVPKM